MHDQPARPGGTTIRLALVYLVVHAVLTALAQRHISVPRTVFIVDAALFVIFWALLRAGGRARREPAWLRFLSLWGPVFFFWWAYRWAGWTLTAFFPPDFSLDAPIIAFEQRAFGQPSLSWARQGSPPLTELLHVAYATYYLYTPVLGIYLYARRRYADFERMAFAVLLGYSISFVLFALLPVDGPRWALVDAGLLDPAEQRLRGYWITAFINHVQWDGIALRGGAMPSSHTSTGLVFAVWSWRLWGRKGGVPATIILIAMAAGAVYGRYHYVVDLVVGALIGLASLEIARRCVRSDAAHVDSRTSSA